LVADTGTAVGVDVSAPQADSNILALTPSDSKSIPKRVFFIEKLSSSCRITGSW
jgi:hypothetical protein